ncbi:protein of unknown function DUF81 [Segniliparus rotundus DSM 44985]|uniref:Uncharacterized protein n=1 Tax=Segniliparus rotundus (strain ATCC BAA-972 / CDC 1076 / CIP 108378 / DSM 44985 / JCM 13578) TaxID=640132 RepID=D6Z9Q4_SEGRD|nr:protein of unknown function DUF81 [Segniliparus rotundus DSM 44985]
MPSIKLPAVSWAAATWSAPVAVCACLTAITFLVNLQPPGSKSLTFPLLCGIVSTLSLLLWVFVRTPTARGVALGIFGVPFVLAWFVWLTQ